MAEDLNTDASAFVAEEVEPLALAAIDAVLKDAHYDEGRVEAQASHVCEDVVAALAALKKPFKYIGAGPRGGGRRAARGRARDRPAGAQRTAAPVLTAAAAAARPAARSPPGARAQ